MAISNCLTQTHTTHKEELDSLMTLEFQSNYSGIFREPIDLSTDFAEHKIQKGFYALENSKIY